MNLYAWKVAISWWATMVSQCFNLGGKGANCMCTYGSSSSKNHVTYVSSSCVFCVCCVYGPNRIGTPAFVMRCHLDCSCFLLGGKGANCGCVYRRSSSINMSHKIGHPWPSHSLDLVWTSFEHCEKPIMFHRQANSVWAEMLWVWLRYDFVGSLYQTSLPRPLL